MRNGIFIGAAYCWDGWRRLSVRSVGGVCVAHCPSRSFELGKSFPCLLREQHQRVLQSNDRPATLVYATLVHRNAAHLICAHPVHARDRTRLYAGICFSVLCDYEPRWRTIKHSANPLLYSRSPGGGNLAPAVLREPTGTSPLKQARLWRDVTDQSRRHACRVPLGTFYADSLSGCLPLYRFVLSLLLPRRVDALCSVGRLVSGSLRDL